MSIESLGSGHHVEFELHACLVYTDKFVVTSNRVAKRGRLQN